MKPLVVRPKREHEKSPGKEQAKTGKSGEGARSALEQLIRQERARLLRNAGEPPPDRPPQ
jgi:hypothetical protein